MSYSLVPILVDIPQIQSLLGSKDTAVLQAVIKKKRKEMVNIDAMDDDFDHFEAEIKKDYKTFIAGDFSTIDLNRTFAKRPEEDETEMEEDSFTEMAKELKDLDLSAPGAMEKFIQKHGETLNEFLNDDDEEEEAEEESVDGVQKEITTAEALAHLILGGNPDSSQGFKYGYAVMMLCEHLGKKPFHDSWCSIRSRTLDFVDEILQKSGIKPETFTTSQFLVNRGCPIPIPTPDDFPFIGYLTRQEIPSILNLLNSEKVESMIKSEKEDQDWLRDAIGELRDWLTQAVETDRDLICFYS